ncbi:segregation/condensation protein A [Candidatus Parcubacteria bacterium]|nr:segregation/condensation protein A [Candidatus Parcubacteria bacterium]
MPLLSLSSEEEGSIEDLERRLKLYKRFKELSSHIKEKFGSTILFPRQNALSAEPVFSPDPLITISGALSAIKDVLKNLPKSEVLPKALVQKVVSLEEMVDELTNRIKSAIKMSFKDFSKGGNKHKVDVIVSFLAMLELVKQGIIHVNQDRHFDDIHMESATVDIPHY